METVSVWAGDIIWHNKNGEDSLGYVEPRLIDMAMASYNSVDWNKTPLKRFDCPEEGVCRLVSPDKETCLSAWLGVATMYDMMTNTEKWLGEEAEKKRKENCDELGQHTYKNKGAGLDGLDDLSLGSG